ncbi:cystathionine beta-synthase [Euzebya sp.]|uniref:cystathionine beta-synthase n=1 Tax=Euzebya sp. TaxID=1971409 RepID=UPI003512EB48
MDVANSLLDVVGDTPLVRLSRFSADVPPTILGKVEYMNPGGSVKDRIGLAMVLAAEESGELRPGGTIVEPTSGNTGAGLAIVAAQRGYRCIFVMPDKMSAEKINLLRAYGAEVVVCPTDVDPDDPRSYYRTAERLVAETPGAYKPGQYWNPANPQAHYESTGPEIWRQTDGRIDVFVAGVGTGGTITGTGRYLKEQNPDVVVVGADPEGSIYSSEEVHSYLTEGVGEDFWPDTFDPSIVDRYVTVSDRDAFLTARRLTREEGMLVGGSCGTAAFAALEVAKDMGPDAVIVTLLPDSGRNYLSKIYNDDWMRDHGFLRQGGSARLSEVLAHKRSGTDLPTIVHVHPHERVRDAIATLSTYGVSQMPVVRSSAEHEAGGPERSFTDTDDLIGSIRERGLLDRAFRDAGVLDKTVADVMDEPLPVTDAQDTVDAAMGQLTQRASAVLVCEGSRPVGVLTRADILDFMTTRKGS